MNWIPVSERLPGPCGVPSEPVWVCVQEFGQPRYFAVATCWTPIDKPLFPKWYLDRDFYHLDNLIQIAEPVTHWMPLPDPPQKDGEP